MTAGRHTAARKGSEGQALVEFSLVCVLMCVFLLSAVEIARLILVYTTVANAARAGVRYAVVHGGSRTGSGVDGPSGPGNDPAQVVTVVTHFASAGLLDTSRLVTTVTYGAASNSPGQPVNVTVVYPYDPMTTYFPFQVRLGSTTQGVIEY